MGFLDDVRIRSTNETGFVVEVGRENKDGVRQYLVEKHDKFKDGENDLGWYYEEEIEKIE